MLLKLGFLRVAPLFSKFLMVGTIKARCFFMVCIFRLISIRLSHSPHSSAVHFKFNLGYSIDTTEFQEVDIYHPSLKLWLIPWGSQEEMEPITGDTRREAGLQMCKMSALESRIFWIHYWIVRDGETHGCRLLQFVRKDSGFILARTTKMLFRQGNSWHTVSVGTCLFTGWKKLWFFLIFTLSVTFLQLLYLCKADS